MSNQYSYKKTFDEYKSLLNNISNNEYTLLTNPDTVKTKINVLHTKCNKEFLTTWTNLIDVKNNSIKTKCSHCRYNNVTILNKYTHEKFINSLKDKNIDLAEYKILGKYTGSDNKINVLHTKCNKEFLIRPRELIQGNSCPICSKNNPVSKLELELHDFIKDVYKKEILFNHKGLFDNKMKSVDIYLPKDEIVIEFDGVYWHSESKGKGKYFHYERMEELLLNKNIRTIRIFESEWVNKKEIIKEKIKSILKLNYNKEKVFARKCQVTIINDSKKKNKFLEENHLQGSDKASISIGLLYNDELVSIMTFNKPRLSLGNTKENINKNNYELSRFASNSRYLVVGGFSKLLSWFDKNYFFNEIITYADLRYSDGNLYEKNNFSMIRISDPSYFYFKTEKELFHRFSFRKSILEKKLNNFNSDLTEYQNMLNNGFHRIWDNGCLVYSYKKRNLRRG
jgi:hypothetical protein